MTETDYIIFDSKDLNDDALKFIYVVSTNIDACRYVFRISTSTILKGDEKFGL